MSVSCLNCREERPGTAPEPDNTRLCELCGKRIRRVRTRLSDKGDTLRVCYPCRIVLELATQSCPIRGSKEDLELRLKKWNEEFEQLLEQWRNATADEQRRIDILLQNKREEYYRLTWSIERREALQKTEVMNALDNPFEEPDFIEKVVEGNIPEFQIKPEPKPPEHATMVNVVDENLRELPSPETIPEHDRRYRAGCVLCPWESEEVFQDYATALKKSKEHCGVVGHD